MTSENLNSVSIIGNLVKDCRLKEFENGSAIVEMTIANNQSVKHGDKWESEASFFDVKYSSKAAKGLSAYLVKGTKIAVAGKLVQERWEKDGKKNSTVKIVARSIELLGGRSNSDNSSDNGPCESDYVPSGSLDDFPENVPF